MVHESAVEPVSREQAEQAFGAHRRDFDASPILHDFDQRHQAGVDKIGIFDRGSGGINDVAGRELDMFAVMQNLIANCPGQREKDAIEDFFTCEMQRQPPMAQSVRDKRP